MIGRIAQHRYVSHNAPVVAGTRIPTAAIRRFKEAGYSVGQIIKEYPDLTDHDMLDRFLNLPVEMVITQSYHFEDRPTSAKEIEVQQKRLKYMEQENKNLTDRPVVLSDRVEGIQNKYFFLRLPAGIAVEPAELPPVQRLGRLEIYPALKQDAGFQDVLIALAVEEDRGVTVTAAGLSTTVGATTGAGEVPLRPSRKRRTSLSRSRA